jgi:hypothetical protein
MSMRMAKPVTRPSNSKKAPEVTRQLAVGNIRTIAHALPRMYWEQAMVALATGRMTSFKSTTFQTPSAEFTAHCYEESIAEKCESKDITIFLAGLARTAFLVSTLLSTMLTFTII